MTDITGINLCRMIVLVSADQIIIDRNISLVVAATSSCRMTGVSVANIISQRGEFLVSFHRISSLCSEFINGLFKGLMFVKKYLFLTLEYRVSVSYFERLKTSQHLNSRSCDPQDSYKTHFA